VKEGMGGVEVDRIGGGECEVGSVYAVSLLHLNWKGQKKTIQMISIVPKHKGAEHSCCTL
jgi:hypothetical protein